MKVKRKIIEINEDKCTGCGACIPNCPEGALQIIDGKARLVSDLFCDGLGACIGECPEGAISVIERVSEPYDEKKVMKNITRSGINTIKAHLKHLKDHNQYEYYKQALEYLGKNEIDYEGEDDKEAGFKEEIKGVLRCPGVKAVDFNKDENINPEVPPLKMNPELKNWPVQITLVPSNAAFLKDSDLLIAADCVPFAYPDFHKSFLKGKTVLVGCPKLDDIQYYREKFYEIFNNNDVKSVTVINMEVPCCLGLLRIIRDTIKAAGKDIPVANFTISIKGGLI